MSGALRRRREWLCAAIGVILLGAGARLVQTSHGAMREMVLAGACRAPIRILEPPQRDALGTAVVFHGLSANRRIMQTLGQQLAESGLRVYLVDSPGHGDNTEPFSFARAIACAADTVETLERRGDIQAGRTVLLGHSMGGAIVIHLADRFPAAATIAISPAPMVRGAGIPENMLHFSLPRRMPVNLLVIVGGWEPALALAAARPLVRAGGGERFDREDFRQKRALRLSVVPRATHTSLLFDARVEESVSRWARRALDPDAPPVVARGSPVSGSLLGLAGLMLVFPLGASSVTAALRAAATEPPADRVATRRALLKWTIAALAAVVMLKFWVPLGALRILTGDYLASFLLLAGVALLPMLWKDSRASFRPGPRALAAGCVMGLATVVVFGAWLDWQLTDAWMNAERWWRFAVAVVVCLPYAFAEEKVLGAPVAGQRWRRLALFLALRLIVFLVLLAAFFALQSGQILIPLLAVYLALFSLVQRRGSDAVRRRTGSAAAAALFGAILAAWFIGGVFPLS